MMKCTNCGKCFPNFKKYIFHIEYVHGLKNYYECPHKQCNRLYLMKSDLKKHCDKNHSFFKHVLTDVTNTTNDAQNDFTNVRLHNNLDNHTVTNGCDIKTDTSTQNLENKDTARKIEHDLFRFKKEFDNALQLLIARLYDNLTLTRSAVQSVIDSVQEFLSSGLVNVIKESFGTCSQAYSMSPEICKNLNLMLDLLQNPFTTLNTEYRRLQYFEKSDKLIFPVEHKVGVSPEQKRKNGETTMILKNRFAYHIPMSRTLKLFLETPNVFKKIIGNQQDLLHNYEHNGTQPMTNVVHGNLWKDIISSQLNKEIILPLILYFDDFETGNALGSHAGFYKMGVLYFTVGTIPAVYATRLENIFPVLIFHSNDRVSFGNRALFQVVINEIQQLESDGIIIDIDNVKHKVYFSLTVITGDNLGLHSVLGLFESFSATYYCRFCTRQKDEMAVETKENESSLRLQCDYQNHLENRVGLKENCVWNDLPNFHVYNNQICDVMHDLYEGVFRYDMALVINALLSQNFFNLDALNLRIKYFTYESYEKNVPPDIKQEHLKNKCIIISASEMLCLVKNLRFIVGDLVPETNDVWSFYLKLLDLTEIITSTTVTGHSLQLLKTLIEEHHALYLHLFNIPLKPKHHLLLHYVRVIKKVGPLSSLSCMRFEAKHRDLKTVAQNIRCRKNLPYSLALRIQLKNCYRFMAKRGLDDNVNFGPIYNNRDDNVLNPFKELDINKYICITWYELNGIKYDDSSVLLCELLNDCPSFYQVQHILLDKFNDHEIYFLCNAIEIVSYSTHFKAYKVQLLSNQKIFKFCELYSNIPTIIHKLPNNENYVSISTY